LKEEIKRRLTAAGGVRPIPEGNQGQQQQPPMRGAQQPIPGGTTAPGVSRLG